MGAYKLPYFLQLPPTSPNQPKTPTNQPQPPPATPFTTSYSQSPPTTPSHLQPPPTTPNHLSLPQPSPNSHVHFLCFVLMSHKWELFWVKVALERCTYLYVNSQSFSLILIVIRLLQEWLRDSSHEIYLFLDLIGFIRKLNRFCVRRWNAHSKIVYRLLPVSFFVFVKKRKKRRKEKFKKRERLLC